MHSKSQAILSSVVEYDHCLLLYAYGRVYKSVQVTSECCFDVWCCWTRWGHADLYLHICLLSYPRLSLSYVSIFHFLFWIITRFLSGYSYSKRKFSYSVSLVIVFEWGYIGKLDEIYDRLLESSSHGLNGGVLSGSGLVLRNARERKGRSSSFTYPLSLRSFFLRATLCPSHFLFTWKSEFNKLQLGLPIMTAWHLYQWLGSPQNFILKKDKEEL